MSQIESVGRYELLIELAKGGMAELFLGRLHGVGGFAKLVAIKRILPHLAEDKLFVEMFLNEGRIAAHLSHPNVCQVHELGEANGALFLAMEYLDGAAWDALIREQPRTPPDNITTLRLVAGVIAQACEGLHYAHELRDHDGTPTPVIHRDVSPQNLFITVDGACKVLDFGVSKMMKDGPRTRTGVLVSVFGPGLRRWMRVCNAVNGIGASPSCHASSSPSITQSWGRAAAARSISGKRPSSRSSPRDQSAISSLRRISCRRMPSHFHSSDQSSIPPSVSTSASSGDARKKG